MVNYRIHKNGWTVFLEDFDFKTASQEDADQIAKLINTYSLVIDTNTSAINQLTPPDEKRFCELIGELDKYSYMPPTGKIAIMDQKYPYIARVTGEKSKINGLPGLFGIPELLDWHNNRPHDLGRKPIVYLRSIYGALGSRTSFTNNILAWRDLQQEDPDFANYLKDNKFKLVCGQDVKTSPYHKLMNVSIRYREDTARDLIFTNETGQTSIFIPRLQSRNLLGLSVEESEPIMDRLYAHCTQEKYVYHHDWKDSGEIVLMCQWSGLHCRHPFPSIADRLLHRICIDYRNTTWFKELPQTTQDHFLSL
jgi:hypothetical protein